MTDVAAAEIEAPTNAHLPQADAPPRLVKMRGFGIGDRSTLPISLATGAVIIAAWWAASEARLVSHLFLPTPREVVNAAISFYQDGYANASMWEHIGASLMRILTAAAIAIALGTPIGLLMGLSRWTKGIFDTPIEFYWPLPPLAYLPLKIIWLGIGEVSKITLLTMAMFAPIALSAQAGVRSVSKERVHAALSLGATRFQLLREIVLPSALPEILTGIRIALGVGWGTLVAAELIAATSGIGHFIMSRDRAEEVHRIIITGVPMATRSNRSITSSFSMRMQPYDAAVPIEPRIAVVVP